MLASALAGAGFFGTDGPALATNAFPTFQAAQQFASTQTGSAASGAVAGAASKVTNLGGIAAIGDFFNRLTQANTWLRVGEVAGGLILVYIGLNAAMRNTAAGNAIQGAASHAKHAARDIGTAAAIPK